MNEDAYYVIIREGIAAIYRRYAEGKMDREKALERLADFLVSIGECDAFLSAAVTVKQWRR